MLRTCKKTCVLHLFNMDGRWNLRLPAILFTIMSFTTQRESEQERESWLPSLPLGDLWMAVRMRQLDNAEVPASKFEFIRKERKKLFCQVYAKVDEKIIRRICNII